MPKTLKEIANFLKGELSGAGDVIISGINGINEAKEGDISFILNPKYEALITSTKASCVIIPKGLKKPANKATIAVDNPSTAFSDIINLLFPDRIPHPKGIHPSAIVSKNAVIGKSAALGPYAVVEDGAVIGDNTILYSFCYIGKNVKIGKDCILYPNVTIREDICVGDRVILHPGVVVGSDGFGYDVQRDGSHKKIPQLGTVVIEDDVELGSCTTVDRARFAKTVIGKGSKIDNLCQIAHNVIIGPHCIVAGQCGISGSSRLGRNVVLGGQVGIADHIELGDFVQAGARSGITRSYPPKTVLFGYPARPVDKIKKIIASSALLPKLFERVRKLEAKIKELEK